VQRPAPAPAPPTSAGPSAAAPPVYLTDAERMLLVSCMDVGPEAPSRTVDPSTVARWLPQHHHQPLTKPAGTGPVPSGELAAGAVVSRATVTVDFMSPKARAATGRVVAVGTLVGSRLSVSVSLVGIHMLVRAALGSDRSCRRCSSC
jgi:hypothetical protein